MWWKKPFPGLHEFWWGSHLLLSGGSRLNLQRFVHMHEVSSALLLPHGSLCKLRPGATLLSAPWYYALQSPALVLTSWQSWGSTYNPPPEAMAQDPPPGSKQGQLLPRPICFPSFRDLMSDNHCFILFPITFSFLRWESKSGCQLLHLNRNKSLSINIMPTKAVRTS